MASLDLGKEAYFFNNDYDSWIGTRLSMQARKGAPGPSREEGDVYDAVEVAYCDHLSADMREENPWQLPLA